MGAGTLRRHINVGSSRAHFIQLSVGRLIDFCNNQIQVLRSYQVRDVPEVAVDINTHFEKSYCIVQIPTLITTINVKVKSYYSTCLINISAVIVTSFKGCQTINSFVLRDGICTLTTI